MAAPTASLLIPVPAAKLQRVLTEERDPHRRQRELVRASLMACPGKPRAPRGLAA